MKTQKSRFEGLFETPSNQPRVEQAAERSSNIEERNKEIKKSIKQNASIHVKANRVKANIQLRPDYFKALKQIALEEDKINYEVLDEAVGEYLERRKQRKKKAETTKNSL